MAPRSLLALLLLVASCGAPPPVERDRPGAPPTPPAGEAPAAERRTLTVVGTNDLHGHVRALPLLGGYLANLRRLREGDGGAVLLVDAGDMFQGTVESNLHEGRPVVEAYDILGYQAAAVGNHELDFGPVGPAVTPEGPEDDPRGALIARAAQASFPLLTANLAVAATGERVDWPGMPARARVELAGVTVGIVGVTTAETLRTTLAANVADLAMLPVAETIAREARALREAGATVVVVAAHAGGRCQALHEPTDASSCDPDQEIFEVARALPAGLVDLIVAGHTHAGVAHYVDGVPIIESFAHGRAFGRVDLTVDAATGRVVDSRVHPPRDLCQGPGDAEACDPGTYEGAPVERDRRVAAAIADELAAAEEIRRRPAGVTLSAELAHETDRESPLGNLFADLLRRARPRADLAIVNGGGLRAALPAGDLTYGALYEAFPFDNRFAVVRTTAGALEALFAASLRSERSAMFVSGVRVRARCEEGRLEVELLRGSGRPYRDGDRLTVVTSDFLATGGDRVFGEEAEVTIEDGEPIRDVIFERLRRRGGTLRPDDLHDPRRPRVAHPGARPVRCEEQGP